MDACMHARTTVKLNYDLIQLSGVADQPKTERDWVSNCNARLIQLCLNLLPICMSLMLCIQNLVL